MIFKKIKLIFIFALIFALYLTTAKANPFAFLKPHDITIIQLTDVHLDTHSTKSNQRMLQYSESLLKDAISQINEMNNADIVVFSGDVINHSDKTEFEKFISIANTLKQPWFYAPGNHDVGISGGISKKEITSLLNQKSLYYSYSPNSDFTLIFLDGVISSGITANGYFPKEELDWLDKTLFENKNKKIIIVQHYPVVEPFKSYSHKVKNADEYLQIIDKHKNVIAVLSGHYHASKITIRKNVLHISTPSLVEYPNSFRKIKITNIQEGTKFEIKTISTRLQEVKELSKNLSGSPTLHEGTKLDQNLTITIKN